MLFLKSLVILLLIAFAVFPASGENGPIHFSINEAKVPAPHKGIFYPGDNLIQYYGRIQTTHSGVPRFWAPGVYFKAKFKGKKCSFYLNDQALNGMHNYMEVVVDGTPFRFPAKFSNNRITIQGLDKGVHTLTVCKDTESGNGYLEFTGIACRALLQLPPKPVKKIEFIGNSITCGFGADTSATSCGKGEWYDQHNAYMAYGPLTARSLNAQWELAAVSGIGMIHSCCNMKILMPQVYDKIDMRDDSITYDFGGFNPGLVTICLGQNDGIQDSTAFCNAYVKFVKTVRRHYPNANILLLSSPMANDQLRAELKNYLTSIRNFLRYNGVNHISTFFFEKQYNHGCISHPDLEEHRQIANLLVQYISNNHLLAASPVMQ